MTAVNEGGEEEGLTERTFTASIRAHADELLVSGKPASRTTHCPTARGDDVPRLPTWIVTGEVPFGVRLDARVVLMSDCGTTAEIVVRCRVGSSLRLSRSMNWPSSLEPVTPQA